MARVALGLVMWASVGCWTYEIARTPPFEEPADSIPLRAGVMAGDESARRRAELTPSEELVRILHDGNVFADVQEITGLGSDAALSVSVLESPDSSRNCDMGPLGVLSLLTFGVVPGQGSTVRGVEAPVRVEARHAPHRRCDVSEQLLVRLVQSLRKPRRRLGLRERAIAGRGGPTPAQGDRPAARSHRGAVEALSSDAP